jgi:hypothetical protein
MTDKKRYLISAYYSDWIEAESQDEAMDTMQHRIHDLKRHEWEITCQESDEIPQ